MSSQGVGYTCKMCGRTIPLSEKIIHELNCKPSQNLSINCIFENNTYKSKNEKNKITSKTLVKNNNNINDKNVLNFTCYFCGLKMNLNEKEDHLLCHDLQSNENSIVSNYQINANTINAINTVNNNTQNEEVLNPNNIDNLINIEGNYFNQALIGENDDYLVTQNNVNYNNDERFLFDNYTIYNNPVDKKLIKEFFTNEIEDINKFPHKKCPICLDFFINKDNYIILPCLHTFHSNCIINWMNRNDICPLCKFKLSFSNINSTKNFK